MSVPLTAGLASWVASPGLDEVPADLLPVIRGGFVDTLACLLGGRAEPVTRAALALAARRGAEAPAQALMGERRLEPAAAAFVNAVSAHALDYDDMALNGHPSVVLVPALLAAAEPVAADDRRLLLAYLVGYEVWAELAGREPDALHVKGWHPTGAIGTVAAAAAVARLRGLDAAATAHALGIAASMAGGLMGNFGSMTKPLHAGWAAGHALEAVELAALGVTASADVLEGRGGFLMAFSPAGRVERGPWTAPGELRMRQSGLSVKKYPVCYASHRVIDGVLDLRAAHGVTPADVREVAATISDVNARVLHCHRPTDALQAKFSLEFACAVALCEGAVGLREVTDGQVGSPDVQALMARVSIDTVPAGCPIEPSFALHDRVLLRLHDGRVLDSGPIRFARGHVQKPLSAADLRTKFFACVAGQERERAGRLLAVLEAAGNDARASIIRAVQAFAAAAAE